MKKSTRKCLNIVLLTLWAAVVTTACARGGMSADTQKQPVAIGEPEELPDIPLDPTGDGDTPGGDIHSGDGHDTTPPDIDDVVVTPVDPPTPPTPPTEPNVPPTADNNKIDTSNFIALSWETPKKWGKKVAQAKYANDVKKWSQMIYTVIEKEEPQMLNKKSADDVQFFCPTYYSLSRAQRLNFWGEFFVALAFPESGWDPASQMTEPGMGIDPVTKKQVRSEGLLQLSYQDEKNNRLDCGFDFEKDKAYTSNDVRRSILDPYLNLRCGIKIMANQLKKFKSITMRNNVYWSVLRLGGQHSHINEISRKTKALQICQK